MWWYWNLQQYCFQLVKMGWATDKDHYATMEAKLLHRAITCALEYDNFQE